MVLVLLTTHKVTHFKTNTPYFITTFNAVCEKSLSVHTQLTFEPLFIKKYLVLKNTFHIFKLSKDPIPSLNFNTNTTGA